MKFFVTLLCVVLALLCSATVDADIFSWTDENGVKHYSNVPPSDIDDVELEFKEYQHSEKAEQDRSESRQGEYEKLIKDIENDNKREEAVRKQNAPRKSEQEIREQRIANEKNRLTNKIAELEEKPLNYFGSQRNKTTRIGYYKYRLQALNEDPHKYFSEPTKFEGNVKVPEDSGDSN